MTSTTGPEDPTGPPPSGSPWPTPAGTEVPARRRRRGVAPWVAVVLTVALVAASALAGYLWVRGDRWAQYAHDVEHQARGVGEDLAQLRTEHDGTVAELAAVNEQLGAARTRITELADEKAQVGDDREIQRQLVDYQERVSQAAATVASALTTCTQAQNQLIGYLENAAAYDPAGLAQFKGEVQRVCAAATDANTELQRQLAAGTDG